VTKKAKLSGAFLTASWTVFRELRTDPDTPESAHAMLASSTRSCLRVIAKLATTVPVPDARASLDEIKTLLLSSTVTPDVIAACLDAVQALICVVNDSPSAAIAQAERIVAELFERAHSVISSFISAATKSNEGPSQATLDTVSSALFTVGAAALVGFFADDDGVEDGIEKRAENYASQLEWLRGMMPVPPVRLIQIVQVLLPPVMPRAEGEGAVTPSAVRALAFIT
jgi:hypothetical protein